MYSVCHSSASCSMKLKQMVGSTLRMFSHAPTLSKIIKTSTKPLQPVHRKLHFYAPNNVCSHMSRGNRGKFTQMRTPPLYNNGPCQWEPSQVRMLEAALVTSQAQLEAVKAAPFVWICPYSPYSYELWILHITPYLRLKITWKITQKCGASPDVPQSWANQNPGFRG